MATDLETSTNEGETPQTRPSLKITRLHIKGLKSIGSLDLPEDGLGWGGEIPDFVMVGGINGSGKTTLLELIVRSFKELVDHPINSPLFDCPDSFELDELIVDITFNLPQIAENTVRFMIGSQSFLDKNVANNWFGYLRNVQEPPKRTFLWSKHNNFASIFSRLRMFTSYTKEQSLYVYPTIAYFPSEGRSLTNLGARVTITGNNSDDHQFVYRWQQPKTSDAPDPLIKRIYDTRYEDMSAKEAGFSESATGFESYSRAFDRFFEGKKSLQWTAKGKLIVATRNGSTHDLSQLSSGEKQVILFMGELLHRWHPGSLILIDEPELHLHESYQTRLWEALVEWQKERGGQVILATQSAHLFGLSGPGTRVILSGRSR